MFHTLYPHAQITGVDIDAVMLSLGKKYFGLSDIPQLSLIVADAKDFVQRSKRIPTIVS